MKQRLDLGDANIGYFFARVEYRMLLQVLLMKIFTRHWISIRERYALNFYLDMLLLVYQM